MFSKTCIIVFAALALSAVNSFVIAPKPEPEGAEVAHQVIMKKLEEHKEKAKRDLV